jgi:glutaconate CoA-transferase subunit B
MESTPDEIMVANISHQIHDGELVVQGLATPLIAAAYLLARHTHAPNLYFASAIGQSICRYPAPLSISRIEDLWLDRAMTGIGFVRTVCDVLPNLRPKEFFRPGQIDPRGNFNNIAIGKNYRKPRLRLPGTGGIPDVTTFISDIMIYVPRHSKITFVSQLDYTSGMGHNRERVQGRGPQYLISNLGRFDFANGRMRLVSYHPDTSITLIQTKTGFDFDVAPDVHETPLPTENELQLLRNEIDPLCIRKLESLSGAARRLLLHEIISKEERRVIH